MPYQRSHSVRRWPTSRGPMPVSRTSLPGVAVVTVTNRCRANRLAGAARSSADRSIAGRQPEVTTVGTANRANSANAGCTDISSATLTPSRRIQLQVENTDMYMWSSTNTWSRRTARRSSSSGRSWWAIVATDACNCATCPSSAMVTLSRNRRCTRVLTVRRNQVAAAEPASPKAAPSRVSQTAMSASGNAASRESTKAASNRPGSCRYPRRHSRHIDERAGGRSSALCEDIVLHLLLALDDRERLGLQVEHLPVPAAERHQLVVRAQLDDLAPLDHADPVGMPHRGEPVRDEDRRAVPGGGEDPVEDLRLA